MYKSTYFLILMLVFFIIGCNNLSNKKNSTQHQSSDPKSDLIKSSEPFKIVKNNLKYLTENSPLIFIGELFQKNSELDKNKLIFTNNHFQVKKIIKGNSSIKKISIKTLGGYYNDKVMNVSHMPIFYDNIDYLIFMDPNNKKYGAITLNLDGVFISQNNEIYSYGGYRVLGIENDKFVIGSRRIIIPDEKGYIMNSTIKIEPPKTSTSELIVESIDDKQIDSLKKGLTLNELENYIKTKN